ncbi:App1 family protein [Micrococcoides hystricis]|uniref:App1 family protein n=1 Tax=Micrococcoides hystricis TaxID=1572761 RepID=A0ABV6P9S5_9MICC
MVQQKSNVAAKIEDSWHAWRYKSAQKKGLLETVLSFTGYGSQQWVRIFARVVMAKDGWFEDGRWRAQLVADGVRGWRNFTSPTAPFTTVTAIINGQSYQLKADRGGIIDMRVKVQMEPGWHRVELISKDQVTSHTDVYIVADGTQSGIVCDIDDTVLVTALPRPMLAAWNSFVLDEHARSATPGMAVMTQRLLHAQDDHAPMLYLSTGSWNVAQTLSRFLRRHLYPYGALLLTDWGPTEERWFRSGREHKIRQLKRLAVEFPNIRWLLIGDDGQHDPEIYSEFAQRYPDNVKAIIIRQLTPSEAVLAGGRTDLAAAFQTEAPWAYAPDGARLSEQLIELGLLPVDEQDPVLEPSMDQSPSREQPRTAGPKL